MTTAIYCRLSRDRDNDQLAVGRQEHDCRQLCEAKGWGDIVTYVDNDLSAYNSRKPRPEYLRMLDDIKNGAVGRVVVWHPDRLHRSPRELEDFIDIIEASGADVATVTAGSWDLSTPDGRFMARIVGGVARKESEDKSRRLRRKHDEIAAAGRVHGGGMRPFGYRRVYDQVGKIVGLDIDPGEALIVREMMTRFLAGEQLRTIATDLDARGIPTSQGGRWTGPTLRYILRSGRISGQREHKRVIVAPADWPAIVTPAETARARAILDDNSQRFTRAPRAYVLKGLLRCGLCDVRMAGGVRGHRDHHVRAYSCPHSNDRPGCGRVSMVAEPLELIVVEAVFQSVDAPSLTVLNGGQAGDGLDEIADARAQLAELAHVYGQRQITLAEWLAARAPIEARIDQANRTLAAQRRSTAVDRYTGKPGALRKKWDALGLEQQNASIAAVVDRIIIAPARPGWPRFDPDRVTIEFRD